MDELIYIHLSCLVYYRLNQIRLIKFLPLKITLIATQREQKAVAEAISVQPGDGRFLQLFEFIQAVLRVVQVFVEGAGLLSDQFADDAHIDFGREMSLQSHRRRVISCSC